MSSDGDKASTVLDRPKNGTVVGNDVSPRFSVLSCVARTLLIGRPPATKYTNQMSKKIILLQFQIWTRQILLVISEEEEEEEEHRRNAFATGYNSKTGSLSWIPVFESWRWQEENAASVRKMVGYSRGCINCWGYVTANEIRQDYYEWQIEKDAERSDHGLF